MATDDVKIDLTTTTENPATEDHVHDGPQWKLYYWHKMAGRGEFARLMFVAAGIEYEDVSDTEKSSESCIKFYKNEFQDKFPVLCPPIIECVSDGIPGVERGFVMHQSPAILQFLGRLYGLYPENNVDEAHAMQINQTVTDYLAEGHDAFHPIKKTGPYETQKEAAKEHIRRFREERMPRYLKHLEKVLKLNQNGENFFFGQKMTYVDIAVFHILRATEFQFKVAYNDTDALDIPCLRGFKERMEALPNIAQYLASDRCHKFCGNSMM